MGPIKAGDVVNLKTGEGPMMVVSAIRAETRKNLATAVVWWVNRIGGECTIICDVLPVVCLTVAGGIANG